MKINENRVKAFELRKEGKSYKQIGALLNLQKSTIAYWFRGLSWSEDIRKQLTERAEKVSRERLIRLNNLKKVKWAKFYERARNEAEEEFKVFKTNPLFIAGIMIYWGEGSKTLKSSVKIANTDPEMLMTFNNFLKKICKIEPARIKAWLLLYPDLKQEQCLEFWSKYVNIPKENFYRSTVIAGRHKSRRLGYGVCSINVSSFYLQRKMLRWIELFVNDLRE